MGRGSQLSRSNRSNNNSPKITNNSAIVYSVILTEDNIYLKKIHGGDSDNYEELSLEDVGSIVVRPVSDSTSNTDSFIILRPIDPMNVDYPIIGETVEIVYQNGKPRYRRISSINLSVGNATPNADLLLYPKQDDSPKSQTSNYKEVSSTGTSNANSTTQNRQTKFGKYFTYNKINQLKPFEGDKIIQSRFGQSIRFSGYNNTNNVFSPTIIIRNGQNQQTIENSKLNSIIEEDINNDGSTILIGSGEYQSNFLATTDIKLEKFTKYPTVLDGNQLIFNSDRIILSAKTGNMIFHSKGNYGFISDGKISIDNELGADLDFGDDVNITTDRNGSNVSILTGDGKLFLNTNISGKSPNTDNPSEPLVRGNELKSILEELIDLIGQQVYSTPAGPTSPGPVNTPAFKSLKRRLSEMLSTLNYTE